MAASPLKDDLSGYKDSMDETCWSPLNFSCPYSQDYLHAYVDSKTLSEKESLRCNGEGKLEVVSLACGLVGGEETLQPWPANSMLVMISQFMKDRTRYGVLTFLEELMGKVPIVHIEDVSSAFIFCIETEGLIGRYLCVADYLKTAEIGSILQKTCFSPDDDIQIPDEFIEDTNREIKWGSTKLEELGFQYKYNAEMILQGSVMCFLKLQENVQ